MQKAIFGCPIAILPKFPSSIKPNLPSRGPWAHLRFVYTGRKKTPICRGKEQKLRLVRLDLRYRGECGEVSPVLAWVRMDTPICPMGFRTPNARRAAPTTLHRRAGVACKGRRGPSEKSEFLFLSNGKSEVLFLPAPPFAQSGDEPAARGGARSFTSGDVGKNRWTCRGFPPRDLWGGRWIRGRGGSGRGGRRWRGRECGGGRRGGRRCRRRLRFRDGGRLRRPGASRSCLRG